MPGLNKGIKISLSTKKPPRDPANDFKSTKPKPTVAEVFNDDSDSEEEMPVEARIRMRNIGKDTPTSAGPNSYGKTNKGFTDRRAEIEKQLRQQLDNANKEAEKRKLRESEEAAGNSETAKKPRKDEEITPRIQDLFADTVQEPEDSS